MTWTALGQLDKTTGVGQASLGRRIDWIRGQQDGAGQDVAISRIQTLSEDGRLGQQTAGQDINHL